MLTKFDTISDQEHKVQLLSQPRHSTPTGTPPGLQPGTDTFLGIRATTPREPQHYNSHSAPRPSSALPAGKHSLSHSATFILSERREARTQHSLSSCPEGRTHLCCCEAAIGAWRRAMLPNHWVGQRRPRGMHNTPHAALTRKCYQARSVRVEPMASCGEARDPARPIRGLHSAPLPPPCQARAGRVGQRMVHARGRCDVRRGHGLEAEPEEPPGSAPHP